MSYDSRMTAEAIGTGELDDKIELSLTDARSQLSELVETTVRDGR